MYTSGRVLDVGGWLDNWSLGFGEIPRALRIAAALAATAGAATVVMSWRALGVGASWWLAAPIGGIGIDALIHAVRQEDDAFGNALIGYAHALLLAAGFAMVAFAISDAGARGAFGTIAACLALASGPLLTRAWAATLFARHMIGHAEERRQRVRAALAGESSSLVVRVSRMHGEDAELVALGDGGEHRLRIEAKLLNPQRKPHEGFHYLLDQPELGEAENPDGYRDWERIRRVRASSKATFLGRDPSGLPPSVYADEVRAGIVAFVAHHLVVAAASFLLAGGSL